MSGILNKVKVLSMKIFTNSSHENALATAMYAHYGYAIYLSQIFEKGLVSLLHGFLALENKGKWPYEKLLAEVDKLNKQTLGKLLEQVRSRVPIESATEACIQEALKRRNFLIHHYFNTHAAKATVTEGQKFVIADLIEYRNIIEQANIWIMDLNRELVKKIGITDEKMATIVEKLREEELLELKTNQKHQAT